jgi:hypothetical protein
MIQRLLIGMGLLFLAADAWAGSLDATWTAPTKRTDGSPLTDLAQFRVYWQLFPQTPCPGTQFIVVNAPGGAPASAKLTTLTQGFTYNVQATAVDSRSQESACSNMASAVAKADVTTVPEAATNLNLAFSASSPGAQTVLDTDLFTGLVGTRLNAYSPNWPLFANHNNFIMLAPTGGISMAEGGGFGANKRTGRTWTSNQWAEATIGPAPATAVFFVGVRMADTAPAGVGYGCGWVGDSIYRIIKWETNGQLTTLAVEPTSRARQAGDVLNCQAKGQTITMTVTRAGAPTATLSTTDARLTTGTPGIFVWSAIGRTLATGWRAGSVQ